MPTEVGGSVAFERVAYEAEVQARVRREEMFRDAIGVAGRVKGSLLESGPGNDTSEYGQANLKIARKHAERLLAIIVELGG